MPQAKKQTKSENKSDNTYVNNRKVRVLNSKVYYNPKQFPNYIN